MEQQALEKRYIHGYQEVEQERLREQALVIEKPIYDALDFNSVTHLLEIGSGVGAQTEVLLRRFPHLQITGVEYEAKQIQKAIENMHRLGYSSDQVNFIQQDAHQLDLPKQYDGAFVCWVLEHVGNPLQVLKSMKPFLKSGAPVSITEVFNASFYIYPVIPAVMHYWQVYNEFQRSLGGNPDIGAQIGNLLDQAGYQKISLRADGFHLDQRDRVQKDRVFDYWKNLMSSGAPLLISEGLLKPEEVLAMQEGLDVLKSMEDSIFYYSFIQASAIC
ncbi:class I SAM-dependent methyltransferase [Mongoliitalea daihaiensis]|uniref:class I SAM-dependent methyltransferase n=1 Tax=Mongoliitalea daihaiensis TaxID=2782006 RepID=UPI001F2B9D67|nr:class I SAM-dependent methyltransferase [Mongoliitalea daihaiensis]UJP65728.1 methyltransferase [Mongoliitalea daihaiensis]